MQDDNSNAYYNLTDEKVDQMSRVSFAPEISL